MIDRVKYENVVDEINGCDHRPVLHLELLPMLQRHVFECLEYVSFSLMELRVIQQLYRMQTFPWILVLGVGNNDDESTNYDSWTRHSLNRLQLYPN